MTIFKVVSIRLVRVKIDDIDLDIIHHLQEDGRMSFRALGKKLGVPHTTVFTRVQRLKKKGIIKKFSAILHPHDVGQIGIIIIDAPPSESKEIAERIAKFPEAKKVFRTFDGKIIIKAVVSHHPEQKGLEYFLTKLNGYPMSVYPVHDIIRYDHTVDGNMFKDMII